ncbi:MAG: tRNA (adenosine(37)-N6)-threonylcarbamoyltransferase complex dimerization subunit type 1 TsaB, partial [Jiangellaceae bacterium]
MASLNSVLLALDTSSPAVTVAVADGGRVLAASSSVDARRHVELLAPAIVDTLARAGIDRSELTGIAVGTGPGPFTGLRIGLTTARTLGLTLHVPVHGVCSLDVIAADVPPDGPFVVVTDARRREVYWASYAGRAVGDAAVVRTQGPVVVPPDEVATELPAAGAGARLFPEAFPRAVAPEYPSAATLARAVAAGTVDVGPPEPLYLRRPDARPPGGRKRV